MGFSLYLKGLRARFPDHKIGICSHSTGAQVVAEALRILAGQGQQPVDNYVIMQGALPAQSYDSTQIDTVMKNT